jgi:hypothetical protein
MLHDFAHFYLLFAFAAVVGGVLAGIFGGFKPLMSQATLFETIFMVFIALCCRAYVLQGQPHAQWAVAATWAFQVAGFIVAGVYLMAKEDGRKIGLDKKVQKVV